MTSITLQFKIQNGTFVVANGVSTCAKKMQEIFEAKKVRDLKTEGKQTANWDEFTARISNNPREPGFFLLKLTSKDGRIVYDLEKVKPETAEALIGTDSVNQLRNPPKPAAPATLKPPAPIASPAVPVSVAKPISKTSSVPATPALLSSSSIFTWLLGESIVNSAPLASIPAPVQVQRPGLRGLSNGGHNLCFINSVFQMLMNEPSLVQALLTEYPDLIENHEADIAVQQSVIDASRKVMAAEDKERTSFSWVFFSPTEDYQISEIELQDSEKLQKKSQQLAAGYRGFLEAEKIYRTNGDEKLLLNALRNLLAAFDKVGKDLYTMGDAAEVFEALFNEIDLSKYGLGFQDRFVRNYITPKDAPLMEPRTEDVPGRHLTLQVVLSDGKTGQQLVDEMFQVKRDNGAYIKKHGFTYHQETEQRTLVGQPKTLLVQLKRFTRDGKISGSVAMPQQLMIQGIAYNLKSIAVHSGAHYIAYLRKPEGWFYADDSSMTSAGDISNGLNYGYLYFYEKA